MKKAIKIVYILVIVVFCIDGISNTVYKYYESKNVEMRYRDKKIYIMNVYKDSKINNEDLRYLQNDAISNNLEILGLHNESITDEGIKYLLGLKKLRSLGIYECQLTDKGMEYIGQLENLEELDISQTKVTDEGLKHLKGLKKLKELILSDTAITGEGFKYLKELPNLRVLVVSPNVRVENLKYLEGMQLEFLNIAKNKGIDDSAIPYLLKIKTLEDLIVFDTRISEKGVEVLRKGLPKCSIRDVTGGKDG